MVEHDDTSHTSAEEATEDLTPKTKIVAAKEGHRFLVEGLEGGVCVYLWDEKVYRPCGTIEWSEFTRFLGTHIMVTDEACVVVDATWGVGIEVGNRIDWLVFSEDALIDNNAFGEHARVIHRVYDMQKRSDTNVPPVEIE